MQQEQPPPPPPPSGIAYFNDLIAALKRTVWGRNFPMTPVLLANIIRPVLDAYISGYTNRFAAIVARWRAGTLRRPPIRTPRHADAAPAYNRPLKPRPKYDPPRTRGWLGQILSWQGRGLGRNMLDMLRKDPEMRALLVAAPQLTRILGPLLRSLGQRPEPGLLPPLPPRRSRAKPPSVRAVAAHAKPVAARKPRARALDPRYGKTEADGWQPPHHPDQVRARLTGYRDMRLPKRS